MVGRQDEQQSDLGALDLRARNAALETTNAHLTAKVAELSFLSSAAAKLGSTLDRSAIAAAVVESSGVAVNERTRPRFLLLRMGNALAYGGGAYVLQREVERYADEYHEVLERCLRLGEVVSAGGYVAVPIPGDAHEPGFGCIIVADEVEGRRLTQSDTRRLRKLADLAGRSLENARLLAHSVAAGVTDELTGVYNRRYFDRRLGEELRRVQRLGERMGLILLDLDYFKTVNDRFGHPEGDRTLRVVAQTLVAMLRDIDVVTRWGGEEFAIVLPGSGAAEAVSVAERVRAAVQALRLKTAAGAPFEITVSCGVAWAASHLHTPAQCVAAADRCLLEAKRLGRNRTVAMEEVADARQGRSRALDEISKREHRGAARDA